MPNTESLSPIIKDTIPVGTEVVFVTELTRTFSKSAVQNRIDFERLDVPAGTKAKIIHSGKVYWLEITVSSEQALVGRRFGTLPSKLKDKSSFEIKTDEQPTPQPDTEQNV
ncbi:MAG: hypothetical protein GW947_00730 [Candidatus Pacebacteria bacterium]|nr:hypothetical protein [Candidatus Paceibacterota bacterium]PIR60819.1 MAG: hypothetical protein COU68_02205 [Candidatus Pacebacteria bacterium CG10_big_fil_rev_8_21_14_0_10_45_6]